MSKKSNISKFHGSDELRQDQGVLFDCIQCSIIYPGEERPDCPECHGKKNYFLTAQMVDKISSQKLVVNDLIQLIKNENILEKSYFNSTSISSEQEKLLKKICLKLLKDIQIYNFDLKLFLADVVRKLELHG